MAKGGGAEVGTTKREKAMKIIAIVDRHGLVRWEFHTQNILGFVQLA
jgi:hypothetical protein